MYQQIEIIGNLGADPVSRMAPSGDTVTQLNVATNRTYTKDGEKIKEVTWFRISVWGAQGDAVNQYLKKGSLVFIAGTLQPDKETGNPRVFERKDGSTGSSYEVRARDVRFLTKATEGEFDDTESKSFGDEEFPF